MRPVERGSCPTDHKGVAREFSSYFEAKGELIKRLGEYCSYCEIPIPSAPELEHILPKSLHPELELDWNNFLLACINCNRIKGAKNIKLEDYYWPDRHNTACIFKYKDGGIVDVNPSLTATEEQRAQRTLKLTGLDRQPDDNSLNPSDRRWFKRREVWGRAERSLRNLKNNDTPSMRDEIVENAKSKGFWSVWMTVFSEDSDMLRRFVSAFPGTFREDYLSLGDQRVGKASGTQIERQLQKQEKPPQIPKPEAKFKAEQQTGEESTKVPQTSNQKWLCNYVLREQPRHQRTTVIPSKHEFSFIDWLESSGRLISCDPQEPEYSDEANEEISDLMAVDDVADYDIDDDDDLDLDK